MKQFIETLEIEFQKNENMQIALEQKAYMRNQFEYYGLKAPERRKIQAPFLVKQYLPEKKELHKIVKTLWEKPQRDYQYFSQELVFKYVKQLEKGDMSLFEYMVTHKSWWDTIDFIAVKCLAISINPYPHITYWSPAL